MKQQTSDRMNESTVQHPILDAARNREKWTRLESRALLKRILALRNAALFEDLIQRVIFHEWTSHGAPVISEKPTHSRRGESFTPQVGSHTTVTEVAND